MILVRMRVRDRGKYRVLPKARAEGNAQIKIKKLRQLPEFQSSIKKRTVNQTAVFIVYRVLS